MRPRQEDNAGLHGLASAGLAVVVFVCAGGLYVQRGWAQDKPEGPAIEDLEVIEASIAYKKAEPQKQPQKKKRAAEEKKVEGVSRDETKVPEEKKDEPKSKIDDEDPLEKYRRENQDEDLDVGKVVDDPGVFDPDAPIGWAEETKGDPYFQKLIQQLREGWEYPELLQAEGVPVGCMRLERDGRVSDTLFKEKSGNAELDDSVERALKTLEKVRKDDPPAVPEHLLKHTTRWICFKFEV
jgi:hypothetical protein